MAKRTSVLVCGPDRSRTTLNRNNYREELNLAEGRPYLRKESDQNKSKSTGYGGIRSWIRLDESGWSDSTISGH